MFNHKSMMKRILGIVMVIVTMSIYLPLHVRAEGEGNLDNGGQGAENYDQNTATWVSRCDIIFCAKERKF